MQRFFSYLNKLANKNQLRKEKFNQLSYQQKFSYLKNNFQMLGIGSSRITFLINSGKVIKLARNDAGKAQNKVEFDNLLKLKSKFIPKAFDRSPDSIWIEMEFVPPVKSFFQFANYFDLPESTITYLFYLIKAYNLNDFDNLLKIKESFVNKNYELEYSKFDYSTTIIKNKEKIDQINAIIKNQELSDLYKFIFKNLKGSKEDLSDKYNIGNFGIINDQIKIIDLGFDDFVSEIYYPLNDFDDPKQYTDPELFINEEKRPFEEYLSPDPHNVLPSISKIDLKRKEKSPFNNQITLKP